MFHFLSYSSTSLEQIDVDINAIGSRSDDTNSDIPNATEHDEYADDDVAILQQDPEERVRDSTVESEISFSGMHCNHREHFKFAFNVGMFISLVLLLMEAIYAYVDSFRDDIVLYLWTVRAVYYLILLAVSLWCAAIVIRTLPQDVSNY